MKKVLSVILCVSLIFSFGAVMAFASTEVGGDYSLYYVTTDLCDGVTLVPIDGYLYVAAGDDFSFYLEVDRDEDGEALYSLALAYVTVDDEEIEADAYGIYTIENVTSDITISVVFVNDVESTNFLASLLVFIREIINYLWNAFTSFFTSIAS